MIDFNKPIECNGIAVKPLTGWTEGGLRYCLVDYRGTVCVMDELHGAITASKFPHVGTATNTPPKPNLVGVKDVVSDGLHTWVVLFAHKDQLFCERDIDGFCAVFPIRLVMHKGNHIDGIRQ